MPNELILSGVIVRKTFNRLCYYYINYILHFDVIFSEDLCTIFLCAEIIIGKISNCIYSILKFRIDFCILNSCLKVLEDDSVILVFFV